MPGNPWKQQTPKTSGGGTPHSFVFNVKGEKAAEFVGRKHFYRNSIKIIIR